MYLVILESDALKNLRLFVHRVLEAFACGELGGFARLDGDCLARLRVAPRVCASFRDGKSSESDQGNAISIFQGLRHGIKQRLESPVRGCFRDAGVPGDFSIRSDFCIWVSLPRSASGFIETIDVTIFSRGSSIYRSRAERSIDNMSERRFFSSTGTLLYP